VVVVAPRHYHRVEDEVAERFLRATPLVVAARIGK
jgi:hypothetical protein